jgi:eukaryotic translation initiation factor 2C
VAAPQAAAPFAAALAKEVEQKLFVTENALGPPAAAAAVSKKGPAHPGRPGYGAAGKKVMIHENNFLHNVVDNNLFHNDVSSPHPLPSLPSPRSTYTRSMHLSVYL